jgi:hypothetical protein
VGWRVLVGVALDALDLRRMVMDIGDIRAVLAQGSLDDVSAEYYRDAAVRARRLQADATTPRLKEYLRELITEMRATGSRKRICVTAVPE